MKILAGIVVFTCHFLLFTSNGQADEVGAAFLKIGAGARALGMGSAFTASADDATAIFWNPAGLGRLDKRQVTVMHTEWISDVKYDHLAYAQPTRKGTFAGSVAYLSQGSLEGRTLDRQKSGGFQAQDSALTLSFSRILSARSSYGINVKWVDQRLEQERAGGIALDVGLMQRATRNVTLGFTLQNLGQRLSFIEEKYQLPLSVTGGVGLKLNDLQFNIDARRYVYEGRTSVSFGTEYWLLNRIALRGGYLQVASSEKRGASRGNNDGMASRIGNLNGLNMGLGLRILNHQMDYALSPSAEFGDTHRLSLSVKF